jgi:hypothetical protein
MNKARIAKGLRFGRPRRMVADDLPADIISDIYQRIAQWIWMSETKPNKSVGILSDGEARAPVTPSTDLGLLMQAGQERPDTDAARIKWSRRAAQWREQQLSKDGFRQFNGRKKLS